MALTKTTKRAAGGISAEQVAKLREQLKLLRESEERRQAKLLEMVRDLRESVAKAQRSEASYRAWHQALNS